VHAHTDHLPPPSNTAQDLGDGVAGRLTYAEGAARIAADTLLIGVAQDALIPPSELSSLADAMRRARSGGSGGTGDAQAGAGVASDRPEAGRVRVEVLDSVYGHDAFLKEPVALAGLVRGHLEAGMDAVLEAERVHNTGGAAP